MNDSSVMSDRPRFRYSLRLLFACVTLIGTLLGGFVSSPLVVVVLLSELLLGLLVVCGFLVIHDSWRPPNRSLLHFAIGAALAICAGAIACYLAVSLAAVASRL